MQLACDFILLYSMSLLSEFNIDEALAKNAQYLHFRKERARKRNERDDRYEGRYEDRYEDEQIKK